MTDVEVTEERELTVHEGDTVTVRLPENATTGYVWSLISCGQGLSVEQERSLAGPEGAPGEAGEHIVRLAAREPGTWAVTLRLARAWEALTMEERRIIVRVT